MKEIKIDLSFNKSFILLLLYYIFLLEKLIGAYILHPDSQNPIRIKYPIIDSNSKSLEIRFKFDPKSQLILYDQVFGVMLLNPHIQKTSVFQKSNLLNCALTNSFGITYLTKIVYSQTTNDVIYCKFLSSKEPLSKEATYILNISGISEIGKNISTSNIIKFFTATSEFPTQAILDQNPSFGTFAYQPFNLVSNDPSFVITSVDIKDPDNLTLPNSDSINGLPLLSFYQKFNIIISLTVKRFLIWKELIFLIGYDANLIIANYQITDEIGNFQNIKAEEFETGNILISGLELEVIQPDTIFKIKFSGWNINNSKNFAVPALLNINAKLYYKNSYSLVSYSQKSFANIGLIFVKAEASHPEGRDFWRNGLFPIKFTFSISNFDISDTAFVVIQHTNAENGKNSLNFVASTCDFSENTGDGIAASVNQNFGERPICYPLRRDLEYENRDSIKLYGKGSGFFFKLKSIQKDKNHSVIIWFSADNCGGNNYLNFSSLIDFKQGFVYFKFQVNIYRNIFENNSDEKRFSKSPLNIDSLFLASTSKYYLNNLDSDIYSKNKCINNLIQSGQFDDSGNIMEYINSGYKNAFEFDENFYSPSVTKITLKWGNEGNDINLYKEIHDFSIMNQLSDSPINCGTNCFILPRFNSPFDNINPINESFFYSEEASLSKQSYFALGANLYKRPNTKTANYFPLPFSVQNNFIFNYSGKLQFSFSNNFFTSSNKYPYCYISWDIVNKANQFYTPESLLKDLNYNQDQSGKFISRTSMNDGKSYDLISEKDGICMNSECQFYKITSILSSAYPIYPNPVINTGLYFNWVLDHFTVTPDEYFGFYSFSNCLKYTIPEKIKSLYTNIDIQISWNFFNHPTNTVGKLINEGFSIRNIRFIKLFPEGGVFQDTLYSTANRSKKNSFLRSKNDFMNFHFVYSENGSNNGVCLIEINSINLFNYINNNSSNNEKSSHLVFWLFQTVLLETDYQDLSVNYPLAGTNDYQASIYGLSSGYFLDATENFLTYNIYDVRTPIIYDYNHVGIREHLLYYNGSGKNNVKLDNDLNRHIYTKSFPFKDNRSSYFFLFGSMIILDNTENLISINKNILIPIYCPLFYTNQFPSKNYYLYGNGLPTIYTAWITMKSFDNINSISKIYSQNYSNHLKSNIIISPQNYKINNYNLSLNGNFAFKVLSTLKWSNYNSSGTDDKLFIFQGTQINREDSYGKIFCTGNILLLNKKVEIANDSGLLTNNLSFKVNMKDFFLSALISKKTKFYFNGIEFNRAILGSASMENLGYPNDGISFTDINKSENDFYFIGLKRPLITQFYDNDFNYSLNNYIAYFCVNNIIGNYLMLTNLNSMNTSNNFFILDFNPINDIDCSINISNESPNNNYIADFTGSIKINVKFNTTIPNGLFLNINVGGFINSFTNCNIKPLSNENDSSNNDFFRTTESCSIKNDLTISCPKKSSMNIYQIYCYNVYIQSQSISLKMLYLSFEFNSNNVPNFGTPYSAENYLIKQMLSISKLIEAENLSNPSSNKYIYTLQTDKNVSDLTISSNFIESFKANIVNLVPVFNPRNKNFGSAIIGIKLPRTVRGMQISLEGKFDFINQNIIPQCKIIIDNKNLQVMNSDIYFYDGCIIRNTDNLNTKQILINFKNSFIKKLPDFANYIQIKIFPIVQPAYGSFEQTDYMNNNLYNVRLIHPMTNSTIFPNIQFNFKSTFKGDNLVSENLSNLENLINLFNINPPILGLKATYSFILNFESQSSNLKNANSITFFMNENIVYNPDEIYCQNLNMTENIYSNSNYLSCYFEDEEQRILTVNFDDFILFQLNPENSVNKYPVTNSKNILIGISGIINNQYSPTDFNLLSVVNKVNQDSSGGQNLNVLAGYGKIYINIQETFYYLNFKFLVTSSNFETKFIRKTTTFKYRVTIDSSGNSIYPDSFGRPIEGTIIKNAKIYIVFPKNYNDYMLQFNLQKSNITVTDYYLNSANYNTVINSPTNVIVYGNTLVLDFQKKNLTFNVNWIFWEISISNFPTIHNYLDYSPEGHFGLLNMILIGNNDQGQKYYIASHTNTNSILSNKLTPYFKSKFEMFFEGINFTTEQDKIYTDIKTLESFITNSFSSKSIDELGKNLIEIKPGRYSKIGIIMNNQLKNLINNKANLSLVSHPVIKTGFSDYILNSQYNSIFEIQIGVPCLTNIGEYMINFNISNQEYFISPPPVRVIITKRIISSIILSISELQYQYKMIQISYKLDYNNFDLIGISSQILQNNLRAPINDSLSSSYGLFIKDIAENFGKEMFKNSNDGKKIIISNKKLNIFNFYSNSIGSIIYNISSQNKCFTILPFNLQLNVIEDQNKPPEKVNMQSLFGFVESNSLRNLFSKSSKSNLELFNKEDKDYDYKFISKENKKIIKEIDLFLRENEEMDIPIKKKALVSSTFSKLKFLQSIIPTNNFLKNKITINFKPPFIPYYISCVLICLSADFPNDSALIDPNYSDEGFHMRFYNGFFYTNSVLQMTFNELFRNTKYKLKCVLQTAEYEKSTRKSFTQEIYNIPSGTSTTKELIIIEGSTQIKCYQILANNLINLSVNYSTINSCQTAFFSNKFYNLNMGPEESWNANGCPVCTNLDFSIFPLNYDLGIYYDKISNIPNPNGICFSPHPTCQYSINLDYIDAFIIKVLNPLLMSLQMSISNSFNFQLPEIKFCKNQYLANITSQNMTNINNEKNNNETYANSTSLSQNTTVNNNTNNNNNVTKIILKSEFGLNSTAISFDEIEKIVNENAQSLSKNISEINNFVNLINKKVETDKLNGTDFTNLNNSLSKVISKSHFL